MKAAGYIRVSSEKQAETGHGLDVQCTGIADFIRRKGWTLVDLFSDAGRSGTLTNRPAFQAMMTRAMKGEFEVIVVHSLDRFYRNLKGLLTALEQLRQQRVSFVSVSENLDFTTPWGKLELAVLGSLAELYVDRLRVETRQGKQARARRGLWNGSIPFGYCNGLCLACTDVNGPGYCPQEGALNRGDGKILIAHPIESVAVGLGFDWYATGEYTDRLVADQLNTYLLALPDGTTRQFRSKCLKRGSAHLFTKDSVRDILQRIFYTGQVPYYGTNDEGQKRKRRNYLSLTQGQHPALISKELFERCQQVRQERAAKKPGGEKGRAKE